MCPVSKRVARALITEISETEIITLGHKCHKMINDQCNGSQVPIFIKRRNISTLILQQKNSFIIIIIIIINITSNLLARSKSQPYRRIRTAGILKFWSDIFTPVITNVLSPSLICNTEYSIPIKNCKSQACNEN